MTRLNESSLRRLVDSYHLNYPTPRGDDRPLGRADKKPCPRWVIITERRIEVDEARQGELGRGGVLSLPGLSDGTGDTRA